MTQHISHTPPEQRKDRIYLTGFMGSGKSTIGPIVANTIGYGFVDVDRAIEASAGMSVNAIFRERGEQHFRALERSTLMTISSTSGLVVALGGGTVTDSQNFHLIMTTGIVVYLKISPEQLHRRLRNRNDRPLLAGPGGEPLTEEQLHARIAELYDAREPLYARADITINTDETRLGLTVDNLVRRLLPLLK